MNTIVKFEPQDSLAQSTKRFVEGMTPTEIHQQKEFFEAILRTADAFVASPRGQHPHPAVAKMWNAIRTEWHRVATLLNAQLPVEAPAPALASNPPPAGEVNDDDPRLDAIKRRIAGLSPSAVLQIAEQFETELPSREKTAAALAAAQRGPVSTESLDRRRAELMYLNRILGRT